MSKAELERFSADLNKDQALYDEVAAKAADADSLAALARDRGYDFTAEEARQHARHGEMTEEQLDQVNAAGGYPDIVAAPIADRPTVKYQGDFTPTKPPPSVLAPATVLSVLF
jgi:predicted ribosomally synthesized peptide with nif11-like leader